MLGDKHGLRVFERYIFIANAPMFRYCLSFPVLHDRRVRGCHFAHHKPGRDNSGHSMSAWMLGNSSSYLRFEWSIYGQQRVCSFALSGDTCDNRLLRRNKFARSSPRGDQYSRMSRDVYGFIQCDM